MSETDKKHVGTNQMCINTHIHMHIKKRNTEIALILRKLLFPHFIGSSMENLKDARSDRSWILTTALIFC